IQYGKVQEKILVRSLINNFCKMHALNPAHFKTYDTFYAWEKFLYDQLKLIYMEERDRISSGAFPHPPRTPTAVKFRSRLPKASPLHERIRELTRIYSSSTSNYRAPSVKKYQPRKDFVCGASSKASSSAGGGGKRCECLGKHLLLS
ncbi:Protein NPHP-2, partial [Aphelenchoides avenae]